MIFLYYTNDLDSSYLVLCRFTLREEILRGRSVEPFYAEFIFVDLSQICKNVFRKIFHSFGKILFFTLFCI